jgi:hypothetical protein
MSRAAVLSALALLGALATGVAIGVMVARPSNRPGELRMRTANPAVLFLSRSELVDSLHLSPSQRAAVDSALDAGERRLDSTMARMRDSVEIVTRQTRATIRDLLDERQRHLFDSTLANVQPVRARAPLPPPDERKRTP